MRDNLYTSEQARELLMKGIQRASEAVAITLGTAGKNSLIETVRSPFHYPTNDGISILSAIQFADPLEEMGRQILFESVNRANRANGDGSSTTCVLTSAILEEGMKHLEESTPSEIKKSLEDCIPLIEASLQSQKKELIDTEGNIDFTLLKQVASISAESEEIGGMIADIYKVIGKDGIINWEASKDVSDSFKIGTGIKIDDATYASHYMCDVEGDGFGLQATIENPYVLLAYSKITNQSEMEKLLRELVEKEIKDLVIFCNEMDQPILNSFIFARAPKNLGIRFLVIKMPTVFNDLWWEDLEKASGGRIISPASGIKMKDANMTFLGQFGKITVNREDTFIDGIKDLSNHLMALKVDGSDEALARVARLNTKTARYYVGAHSESTLRQKRDKVEDAVNSAWSAMQNGILPGGGAALLNTATILDLQSTIGAKILRTAVTKPFVQIVQNAGKDAGNTLKELGSLCLKGSDYDGFNSKSGELANMTKEGIIDSFDVVLGAIKNAIGVASGVLTCSTIVLLPRNENSVDGAIKELIQNNRMVQ